MWQFSAQVLSWTTGQLINWVYNCKKKAELFFSNYDQSGEKVDTEQQHTEKRLLSLKTNL